MWKYEKPKMEVIMISEGDVVCVSGVTENGTIEEGGSLPETPFVPRSSGVW